MTKLKSEEKMKLKVVETAAGPWYIGRVAVEDGWNVWVPIMACPVEDYKKLGGCLQMAKWYYLGGLGLTISKNIIRENDEHMERLVGFENDKYILGEGSMRETTWDVHRLRDKVSLDKRQRLCVAVDRTPTNRSHANWCTGGCILNYGHNDTEHHHLCACNTIWINKNPQPRIKLEPIVQAFGYQHVVQIDNDGIDYTQEMVTGDGRKFVMVFKIKWFCPKCKAYHNEDDCPA